MSTQRFSIGEAISFGWKTTWQHFGFLLLVMVIVGVINNGANIVTRIVGEDSVAVIMFASLAFFVVSLLVQVGLITILLKLVRGQHAEFGDLFSGANRLFPYFLGCLLYGLIVLGGLLLLIIPGIIWGIRFQFYSYYIIDKGLGPMDALKASWHTTKGVSWTLFLFGIVSGLINILGVLLLFIGLLATIPITSIAYSYIYERLARGSKEAAASSTAPAA